MITIPYFIILTIIHAYFDAELIRKHEVVDHLLRSVLWFLGCFIGVIVFDLLINVVAYYSLIQLLVIILVRFSVFDFALNLFRGLRLDYISYTTTSKIDQLLNKINIDRFTFKYIGLIVLTIFYFITFFIKFY